jgi:acetyl esterase
MHVLATPFLEPSLRLRKIVWLPWVFSLFYLLVCSGGKIGAQAHEYSTLTYKRIDTVRLELDVYQPHRYAPKEKRPALIFFFGGGWIKGSRNQFRAYATYYAQKGFVVVLADYRVQSTHRTTPIQSLKDAKSVMRFVRIHADSLGIHPDRLVGAGGSAGGHLAAACYTNESINDDNDSLAISAKPNALVLFNPVIDNSKEGYGYNRTSNAFPDFSPLHAMRDAFPPTVFFLGTRDELIPVATAEAFKERVEQTGSTCTVHLFEGQAHGFFNKADYREIILPKIDAFFEKIPWLSDLPKR